VDEVEHGYRAPGKRELPLLEGLRIAAPCDVSWDAMDGNGRVRHCAQCDKQVFNLSAMSRADAEVLVRERAGELCVRLYQRHDGTVLTTDCPVGVRRRLSARALLSVATTALLGGLALLGLHVRKRPEPASHPRMPTTYAAHDAVESMTTASILALENDERVAEQESAHPRSPIVHAGPAEPYGRHTMGAICPTGRGRNAY
jgi:hypothetical protein